MSNYFGSVGMCLHCLSVSWLSLCSNSGSVKMWKYVFIVLIYLVTLEVWKCGNMSSMSLSNNSGSVEMWKCGNMSSMSLSNNSGSVEMWKCGMCLLP